MQTSRFNLKGGVLISGLLISFHRFLTILLPVINSVLILNFAKFTTDFAVVSFIMFWVLCFLTPIMFDQKHFLLKNDICIKRRAKNGVWQHSYKLIFQCKLSSDALEFNSEIKLSSSSCKIYLSYTCETCMSWQNEQLCVFKTTLFWDKQMASLQERKARMQFIPPSTLIIWQNPRLHGWHYKLIWKL